MARIESFVVLGTSCRLCTAQWTNARDALSEYGYAFEPGYESDYTKIEAYGATELPALVVNGEIISAGRELTKAEIVSLLADRGYARGDAAPPVASADAARSNVLRKLGALVAIAVVVVAVWAVKQAQKNASDRILEAAQSATTDAATEAPVAEAETTPEPEPAFPIQAKGAIDFAAIAAAGKPCMVDYGAEGCPPCRRFKPIFLKTAEAWTDRVVMQLSPDVWEEPEVAKDVPLRVVPTQVFFTADGKPWQPSMALSARIRFRREANWTLHEGMLSQEDLNAILEELAQ